MPAAWKNWDDSSYALGQQPISALEAAAERKPLAVAEVRMQKQEFYKRAFLADPRSVNDLAGAICKALDNLDARCSSISVIEPCGKEKIGTACMTIYQRLCQGAASELYPPPESAGSYQ